MHKKIFSPKKILFHNKFSIKCFKKYGEKYFRKIVPKKLKKSAQTNLVTFKSTHNSAQMSSFPPQKSYEFSALKSAPKKFKKKGQNGVL